MPWLVGTQDPGGGAFLERPSVALILAAVVAAPILAGAADLWVDRESTRGPCSDLRDRTEVSDNSPWCSLEAAANAVRPGDIVHVRRGVYTEPNRCNGCTGTAVLETAVGGTWEDPIVFVADPRGEVVLSGVQGTPRGVQFAPWGTGSAPGNVTVDGFVIRDFDEVGINIVETTGIRVRNVEVTGCGIAAISSRRSRDTTVEGSSVHHNNLAGWTSAVSINDGSGINIVRGNLIWANSDEDERETEGHGAILDHCAEGTESLIENNAIWNNEGWCISVYRCAGASVRNNSCYLNGRDRTGTGELNINGRDTRAHNNILVSRRGAPALRIGRSLGYDTVDADFNIYWSPASSRRERITGRKLVEIPERRRPGWDRHSFVADPEFVRPDLGDLALTPTSPAVDSGSGAHAPATDITGAERPLDGNGDGRVRVDRGAYELKMHPHGH